MAGGSGVKREKVGRGGERGRKSLLSSLWWYSVSNGKSQKPEISEFS